jgi:hypothetical protein
LADKNTKLRFLGPGTSRTRTRKPHTSRPQHRTARLLAQPGMSSAAHRRPAVQRPSVRASAEPTLRPPPVGFAQTL